MLMITIGIPVVLAILGFQVGLMVIQISARSKAEARNKELNEQLIKVTNTLASIRVKHGQSWENFIPLMAEFEKTLGPKVNAVFLGQPIDLIYFNENEIVFVEVKTGNSRLSTKQRRIRNLVKDGKIRWAEVKDTLKSVSQDTDLQN